MLNEEIKVITRKISTPLLSRAGKAMKVNISRTPSKLKLTPNFTPQKQVITLQQVQEELRKIDLEKLKTLKESMKPRLTWNFKAVPRSANVFCI
jgi:hypothetical protein